MGGWESVGGGRGVDGMERRVWGWVESVGIGRVESVGMGGMESVYGGCLYVHILALHLQTH